MNSVAIVGLGWLGFPLAKHLQRVGWEVKGSKRTHDGTESMRLNGFEAYFLQLTPQVDADPDDLNELLSVDSLIINIPPSQYFFDTASYIDGIKNLVNEALLHGVQHLLFISSTSVFPQKNGEYHEESAVEPESEVGRALHEIENWLLQLNGVDCDILRLAGLIGIDRHPVSRLAGREAIKGGNQAVNLVHQTDCILAIQLLLETRGYKRLYHLSAPQHPKRADYYQQMAQLLGLDEPHFIADDADLQRIVHGNKIVQELDFEYRYPDPYQMLPQEEQYFHQE
ncbi:Nucleoside-diphosphate-sugar epimerase [Pasteurella testudinis DSM 23072]|uniref:Nucleoside-diphosphate-sugar epimerase n=1 Tax=Pasteurella testudinis DSM 23072 TaxID=1122938 RepID=A0A1W1V9T9_9PAST|nr:SDR family oxidoreductase [Pasteurella testudinis]SMB90016.1 Nucleoside-diphosphate-sugar epimerase [Pasteurella testudinis DSM 23072]SUB51311.1 YeeZ like protein [Pasteurella testudinis]